jgi:hypothetical protein
MPTLLIIALLNPFHAKLTCGPQITAETLWCSLGRYQKQRWSDKRSWRNRYGPQARCEQGPWGGGTGGKGRARDLLAELLWAFAGGQASLCYWEDVGRHLQDAGYGAMCRRSAWDNLGTTGLRCGGETEGAPAQLQHCHRPRPNAPSSPPMQGPPNTHLFHSCQRAAGDDGQQRQPDVGRVALAKDQLR